MVKHRIGFLIRPSLFTFCFVLFLFLIAYVIAYVFGNELVGPIQSTSVFSDAILSHCFEYEGLSWILGGVFVVGIAYALYLFNETFGVVSERTFLPYVFLLFLVAFQIDQQKFSFDKISAILLLIVLCRMFFSYKDKNAIASSFAIGVYMSLASIISVEYVLLLPIVWCAQIGISGGSIRMFLANLCGFFLFPYFILGTLYLVTGENIWSFVADYISRLSIEFVFPEYTFHNAVFYVTMLILSLIASFRIGIGLHYEAVKDSKMHRVIMLFFFWCLGMFFLYPQYSHSFVFLCTIFLSLLLSHLFTLGRGLWYNVLFCVFVGGGLLNYLGVLIFR